VTPLERAAEALVADLQRQAETSGCTVASDGPYAQVDGSFQVEPLILAVLTAIREPSEAMDRAAAECESSYVGDVFTAMIDAALAEPSS
jgi:hypothetical protein